MEISLKTIKMLWGRSANRCAMPECRRALVESETDDASIIGDEAHIVAREEDGSRGHSDLTPEQRDKYGNLLLMCKVHHKVIDDQPEKYTVEVLHQIKNDHIEWVNSNLSPYIDKQKDEEAYAAYVDKLSELADMPNWENWTSHLFNFHYQRISVSQYENLVALNKYILSRVWPKRHDKLEDAFNNFRRVLHDLLVVFGRYMKKNEENKLPLYSTEKFYKSLVDRDEEAYDKLYAEFSFHADLVLDLGYELTRSGNYLCDQIRKFLSSSFRIEEGILLTQTDSNTGFYSDIDRLEFKTNDFEKIKYPGLKTFMETRQDRGYHLGNGISSDYLI